MKIYGKTLPEILAEMPWQFKVIVMAGMIWIPFALIHAIYIFATIGKAINKPGMVAFPGTPVNASVADPSIVATPDKKNAFMAYTIITHYPDVHSPVEGRWAPGIRIAETRKPCKSWSDLGQVVESTQEEIVAEDGTSQIDPAGTWWMEEPSLVYDPGDPGKEYKLFYYKYLWLGPEEKAKGMSRIFGMIAYRYSNAPEARQWSTETWILSAKAKTATFHGNPPDPYNSLMQYHLDEMDPSLKDIWFYARPSVALFDNTLYMTLSGFTQVGTIPDRVVLLMSPDHARTWHYVATILKAEDARKVGPYTKMGGGTLIEKNGKIYFAAVFGDDKVQGLGTFIIPFEDISKGVLQRDKIGSPYVVNHVPRVSVKPTELGGGYAGYSDACAGMGLYVSEYSGVKDNIHIFQTLKDPVEH